jgi:hypothetical protein
MPVQMVAPGDDVRPGHPLQLLGAAQAGKGDELLDIPFIIVASGTVAQIGKPLGFRGDAGQRIELGGGEASRDDGNELGIYRGVRFFRWR